MAGLCEGGNEPPGSLTANKDCRVKSVAAPWYDVTEHGTCRSLGYANRVLAAIRRCQTVHGARDVEDRDNR
ncbi:hypothetical protein ANN_03717 [Periplaneta americana]|uniref:Uncharacterized protein n=1 Tax=Periplaneta americana TaxID=6978 RepID=A0ABQ8TZS1_PERAM|nr:hypothetical protein ANN_03717 [Periplaneta americana]